VDALAHDGVGKGALDDVGDDDVGMGAHVKMLDPRVRVYNPKEHFNVSLWMSTRFELEYARLYYSVRFSRLFYLFILFFFWLTFYFYFYYFYFYFYFIFYADFFFFASLAITLARTQAADDVARVLSRPLFPPLSAQMDAQIRRLVKHEASLAPPWRAQVGERKHEN